MGYQHALNLHNNPRYCKSVGVFMNDQRRYVASKLGKRLQEPALQVCPKIGELAEKIRHLAERLCFLEPDLLMCAAQITAIEKVEDLISDSSTTQSLSALSPSQRSVLTQVRNILRAMRLSIDNASLQHKYCESQERDYSRALQLTLVTLHNQQRELLHLTRCGLSSCEISKPPATR